MLMPITHNSDDKKKIIFTTTGEPFMPARLYYEVHNKFLLIKALRKLKCIGFEDKYNFILSYYKEAKRIPLEVDYQDVPEGLYPVTLAEGCITQTTMHIDTKSLRRAVYIIDFFAKYIPPTIAQVTHFANSNKLTITNNHQEIEEIMTLDYDQFFSKSIIQDIDIKIKSDEIKDIDTLIDQKDNDTADVNKDKIEAKEILNKLEAAILAQELDNYPAVERVAINYDRRNHNDLIKWLTLRAFIKEAMAIEHNKGNTNYSSLDALQDLLQSD